MLSYSLIKLLRFYNLTVGDIFTDILKIGKKTIDKA